MSGNRRTAGTKTEPEKTEAKKAEEVVVETTSQKTGSEVVAETKEVAGNKEQEKPIETLSMVAEAKEEENIEEIAEIAEKKEKLVKVKFIKSHVFNIGVDKISAQPNDIKQIEPHLANKLVGRGIAYILG